MYVVDASVWVARFNPADKFHDDSRDWIAAILPGRVAIVEPVIMLAELSGALSRSVKESGIGERAVAYLSNLPGVSLAEIGLPLARHAAEVASDLNLRGYDAMYVALAEDLQMDLVSWDSDHLARASSRVTVHRPTELLAAMKGAE
jgi:predicted nucleic acid-binding protein